jgi:hypothetical protein
MPSLAYFSILPRWLTDVAQSMTKGNSSVDGSPNVKGFVPCLIYDAREEEEEEERKIRIQYGRYT